MPSHEKPKSFRKELQQMMAEEASNDPDTRSVAHFLNDLTSEAPAGWTPEKAMEGVALRYNLDKDGADLALLIAQQALWAADTREDD